MFKYLDGLIHFVCLFVIRFVYEGYWKTKITTPVDFPVRGMDIRNYVKGPQPRIYKLYGVSVSNYDIFI